MAAFIENDSHRFACAKVSSLLDKSVTSVVCNLTKNGATQLDTLPPNLKDKCLHLMSKRGLITDYNINLVLHDKLRKLDLSDSDITDQALSCLNKCPQLLKIDLNSAKESRTNITSEGIQYVARCCPNLQIVYLRRCLNLTDEAVISLSMQCKNLHQLNVGGCTQLTDRSLQALGQNCHYLFSINFARTQVTDQGVFSLVSGACSRTLKEIDMNGCLALTDEAVEAVAQYCPQITILTFHGCPNITELSRQALEEMSLNPSSGMKQVTWTVY